MLAKQRPQPPVRPVGLIAVWLAVFALLTAGLPRPGLAATLEVGAGKPYPMPSAAAAAAHDGDHINIAAGSYFDCAVWRANDLTIRGAAADTTVITDKTCQGKGLFITYGNNIKISDLTLTRARVADFNGAGLRAEGGNLTLERVRFVNDQDGLLAAPAPGKSIIIRDSLFLHNGTCEGGGGCAHDIYVNEIGLLRLEHTRFFETRSGHHIKSLAHQTEVIGCDLADGPNGSSSYVVDVPHGGGVLLRDNHIEKGPKSENHSSALIIGEDGVSQPTPEIVVEHNTFLVDGDYNSYLVNNMTATEAQLKGNTLQGNAKALRGDGVVH
ncbi:hypothetical protein [Rhodopila sp.]|uniref:hypothetical protein n=1 Tax=Rhodopila sp. TaxID=2480087 RepID=UPI003D12DB06